MYGYNDASPSHLLTTFYGTPYVDLRVDFNSWLPDKIGKSLKEKLTNFYLSKFKKNIENHQKRRTTQTNAKKKLTVFFG